MAGEVITYIGSSLLIVWGAAHLFPTGSIVRNFGEISADNKRTITMEWITEGAALIFTGILVALATYLDRSGAAAQVVYWVSFGFLNILSLVSLFTGFKNSFIAFKLCPFIFSGSSVLIIAGYYLN